MRKSFIPRRFNHVPLLWWLATLGLAVVTGVFVAQSVARAEAVARRYDGTVNIFVAKHSLSPGHVVTGEDISEQQRPRTFLPDSPIVEDPIGSVAATSIGKGEPLTESKLGSSGFSAAVALLREGEQGVAIPSSPATPTVALGDPVELLATFITESGSAPTTRVATNSRVIAINDNAVTVAVDRSQAPAVAFAAARGVVAIALTLPTEAPSEAAP